VVARDPFGVEAFQSTVGHDASPATPPGYRYWPLALLALRDQVVHILEHLCFLAGGVLFWAQIIPSHPLRPRIGYMAQALYSFSAGMVTMLVALVLTFATTPIYSFYATEPRTKDMIPIMVDQTSAGGIMNLSGAILFGTLFMVLVGLWLGKDEEADDELLRYRHPHWRAIV
jgi:cytochrome c oxidase assembly factor CtaG